MDWNKSDFIEYLVSSLIPDYIEDNQTGLAYDLVTAVYFMQNNANYANADETINRMYNEIKGGGYE